MLFSEFFQVNTDNIPQLHGYLIRASDDADIHSLGGKLSFKLQSKLGGHWVWVREDYRLMSDLHANQEQTNEVIQPLWSSDQETYKDLHGVDYDVEYQPSSIALAVYVSRLYKDVDREANQALSQYGADLGTVRLKRVYWARGWDVQGSPAISVSVRSNLIHKQDVAAFHTQNPNAQLEGLYVSDKNSDLKGEIARITGTVKEHRERLLQLASLDESRKAIAAAKDDEPVVAVKTRKGKSYDYILSALSIVVRTMDFDRFNISGPSALKQMKLDPARRWNIVQSVSAIGRTQGWIGDEYSQDRLPQTFKEFDFTRQRKLLFGDGFSAEFNEKTVLDNLEKHGLYRPVYGGEDNNVVRIGIIREASLDREIVRKFFERFKIQMERLGFKPQSTEAKTLDNLRRDTIEKAYSELKEADILLALFPGRSRLETREKPYNYLKAIAVRDGVPTQVIYGETLSKGFAVSNVVLGVLGKTGNIPYILADPLEFADIIVGIDIARESKKRLPGSVNAAATARIYSNAGDFVSYAIQDAYLEGETLDEDTLQSLLPYENFQGKRVIIHRDGYLRGEEQQILKRWGEQIGAEFYPIEVIKSGAPRIYSQVNRELRIPGKGSAFMISDSEAVVVSSPPPFKDSTPMPLQIRSEVLPIDQAIDSVLSLTTLHFGSLRAPKLPVTLHYSDKIAGMVLDGIKPDRLVGNVPYWL